MPSRIDDKTVVPLNVVAILLAAVVSATVTGAFWVKSVNDRLSRIEEKLGVVAPTSPNFVAATGHTD